MLSLLLAGGLVAQEAAQLSVTVPRLVNFSGKVVGPEDKPVSGIAGIAFSIYGSERETVRPPAEMGVLILGDSGYTRQDERGGLEQSTGVAGVSGLPARDR